MCEDMAVHGAPRTARVHRRSAYAPFAARVTVERDR